MSSELSASDSSNGIFPLNSSFDFALIDSCMGPVGVSSDLLSTIFLGFVLSFASKAIVLKDLFSPKSEFSSVLFLSSCGTLLSMKLTRTCVS